jgi:hypothetical protein
MEVEVIDEADWLPMRDRACAEEGLTWDELVACVDECGCHFTGLPESANETHCLDIWRIWRS